MIPRHLEAEILRLYHAEGWRIGTLCRQLKLHRDTVRRVLTQAGIAPPLLARPSRIEPFVPFIQDIFARYPTLRASRLYHMVRERGYSGSADHFRHLMRRYRPRPVAEAYLRLRTLAGEQGQVDWAHFGTIRIGRARRLRISRKEGQRFTACRSMVSRHVGPVLMKQDVLNFLSETNIRQ